MATATRPSVPLPSSLPGVRRTERLSKAALSAVARLEFKLAAGSASNYGCFAERRRSELLALDPVELSSFEFEALSESKRMIAETRFPSARDVARAVTRFEVATARIAELSEVDAQHLSGADFNALGDAQDAVKASREFLTRAGLLHLIDGDR